MTDSSAGHHVELWDLLVGPGMRSDTVTLPGGAVLEVRGGAGRLRIGGQERELRSGATAAVAQGTSFAVVNARADLGLSIRAVIVTARAR